MTDMYITTFYSFKGGVGRTMALVNSAVTLAQRGRRVLVVDFDVEAPGLDTFDVLQLRKEVPGILDFVAEYQQTGMAPDVTNFIGDCPDVGDRGGKLWLMPSGRRDRYTETLAHIDWRDLYEQWDGFLLFEDLKEQWSRTLEPDYALIDSRTGHTDSSGICTRQLPDSVVIFFFPNEQNLRGLTQIVHNIRSEAEEPRHRRIALHFVMSNVPDLDDEDQILEDKISRFQQQLGFRGEPMVVHRYDSLSLLNQTVFSKDRPRSRLAREYRRIVREISILNWQDRDGALEYIQRAGERWFEDESILSRDEQLERIETAHQKDGEILFRLAELRRSDGEHELAEQLLDQAIQQGCEKPEVFLLRARYRAVHDKLQDAVEDWWRILNWQPPTERRDERGVLHLDREPVTPLMVREALRRLAQLEKYKPRELVSSTAVTHLDTHGKYWLANSFNRSYNDLLIATPLWEQIDMSSDLPTSLQHGSKASLGLSYMGLGRCVEAARVFRNAHSEVAEMKIATAFNYGMALWGRDGTLDREIFQRVVDIDRSNETEKKGTNHLQCMAIAYWAVGEIDQALDNLNRSHRSLMSLRSRSEFSCWRYLRVTIKVFEEDLGEMRSMMEHDESLTPRFMRGPDSVTVDV